MILELTMAELLMLIQGNSYNITMLEEAIKKEQNKNQRSKFILAKSAMESIQIKCSEILKKSEQKN